MKPLHLACLVGVSLLSLTFVFYRPDTSVQEDRLEMLRGLIVGADRPHTTAKSNVDFVKMSDGHDYFIQYDYATEAKNWITINHATHCRDCERRKSK